MTMSSGGSPTSAAARAGWTAAVLLGLDIPDACRAGVAANLDLLAAHARLLADFPLPAARLPAAMLRR